MSEPPVVLSTSRRFVRSTLASYWSLAVRLLVTTAARMALGRLVLDQDYGTYDLALRIVTVAGAVRDLGLAYQLMRDPRRPYGTVMAFSIWSGIGVGPGMCRKCRPIGRDEFFAIVMFPRGGGAWPPDSLWG